LNINNRQTTVKQQKKWKN